MSRYLDHSTLPTPPPTCDYRAKASASLSNIFKNDTLGDCVIAAIAHAVGVATGNAGSTRVFTDQEIIALYTAIGGYNPSDPSTDQGCDELTALAYWQQNGAPIGGDKIAGYVAVDPTNEAEVNAAIWLFENLMLCAELPDSWTQVSGSGFVWDCDTPNPNNGHAFMSASYDSVGPGIETWGLSGSILRAAMSSNITTAAGGSCYAVLMSDSIMKASGKAPNGFDWEQLCADFDAIGGAVQVPVSPTPAKGPTKAQVLAAMETALDALTWG
jgi:hypothetical protein